MNHLFRGMIYPIVVYILFLGVSLLEWNYQNNGDIYLMIIATAPILSLVIFITHLVRSNSKKLISTRQIVLECLGFTLATLIIVGIFLRFGLVYLPIATL